MVRYSISCKLSHTVLLFSEHEGLDPGGFFLDQPWSQNWLMDPGQWLDAAEMERFLAQFWIWWRQRRPPTESALEFYRQVAHQSRVLRSWGILDSVLRLMPDVYEVFERPSVLLGHFVHPVGEIQILEKNSGLVTLKWDESIFKEEPLCGQMLLGALELLPTFMGYGLAKGEMVDGVLTLRLPHQRSALALDSVPREDGQATIAVEPSRIQAGGVEDLSVLPKSETISLEPVKQAIASSNEEALFHSLTLSREIFREMMSVIEAPKRRQRLVGSRGDDKGGALQLQWPDWVDSNADGVKDEWGLLQQNLNRILDFFVRASQLVTLLSQQNPDRAQQWMKRLNWMAVQEQFPGLMEESTHLIRSLRQQVEKK